MIILSPINLPAWTLHIYIRLILNIADFYVKNIPEFNLFKMLSNKCQFINIILLYICYVYLLNNED